MLPKTVDTDDMAKLLGIDDRSVRRLVRKGVLTRGALGFDPCSNVVNYIAFTKASASAAAGRGELGAAQVVVYKERARAMRLKNESSEGALIPRSEVVATWSATFTLIRTRMLAIPSKLALRLSLARTPAECATLVDGEIREGLNDIAGTEIVAAKPGRRAANEGVRIQ
jgi:terminase small subunit / prophage DNA-packing protein